MSRTTYHDGNRMSQRAFVAYEAGLVPASKIRGVPASLIHAHIPAEEWHHTGTFAAETNFYHPHAVRVVFGLEPPQDPEDGSCSCCGASPDPQAIAALHAHRHPPPAQVFRDCKVEWTIWHGTRRHHWSERFCGHATTIEVRGVTATITLADGAVVRKRTNTGDLWWQGMPP